MIALKTVSKSYKKQTILRDISHNFGQGVTVITGKSGAGKSTLLRMCATVEKPSSGDILWQDVSILKKPKVFRRVLGYAPQLIDFPPDITALDFLRYIGALKGMSAKNSTEQGLSLLARLELEGGCGQIHSNVLGRYAPQIGASSGLSRPAPMLDIGRTNRRT